MSELRLDKLTIPAARLGEENPLPPLHSYHTASIAEPGDDAPTTTDYPDRGNEASILPYRLQDDYDRGKRPRAFKTAVLENDILRATFMLELGGRLWSLYHKPSGRELLHVNPVFQPANLAVRDAWFSGGVEWNLSIIGHCPFTCSDVFAARVASTDGSDFLRIYEFERIRGVPFQIDFHLPDGSPFLFVQPRISNPNDITIPMYWWSNIAVDETDGMRVIAPAGSAYYHAYDRSLKSHDLPLRDGEDVTYPTRRAGAADLYFRIMPDQRPWIAALDREGQGLVHVSTQRLIGRKMFVWGMDPGGRRWQEHLSAPGHQYIEIQGGLATKQTEYIPMPPGAEWEWLEAYGSFEADPQRVHSNDWPSAIEHVNTQLESKLPRAALEAQFREFAIDADTAPAEILHTGSGWGALETRRRAKIGLPALVSEGTPFPQFTLGPEQEPWITLLERGALPASDPRDVPDSYMTQPAWKTLLQSTIDAGRGVHWLSLLHLGIMQYRDRDPVGARRSWERSLELTRSAWAMRNLAVLSADEGNSTRAADQWHVAATMLPNLAPLAIEACAAMLQADRLSKLRRFVGTLPASMQTNGRVRLLDAIAALRSGDFATVESFFSGPCDIANVREGELSLSELWFGWHEAAMSRREGKPVDETMRLRVRREFPLPKEFDFRMKGHGDSGAVRNEIGPQLSVLCGKEPLNLDCGIVG